MTTPELDFEDVSSAELDDKAASLVIAGALTLSYVENRSVSSLRIDGPCPRCGHSFHQTRALSLPATSVRGVATAFEPAATWADFMCDCTIVHPGTPAAEHGCGASYSVTRPTTTGG